MKKPRKESLAQTNQHKSVRKNTDLSMIGEESDGKSSYSNQLSPSKAKDGPSKNENSPNVEYFSDQ